MLEKMELGEFYRELRKARGLTQKEVARNGLTASELSKFELGHSMLSADRLLLAIEGINVPFDEFGHKLYNYKESQHVQLGRQVVSFFAHQDKKGLENLLKEVEQKGLPNRYMRLNSIVIKNAIHCLDASYPFQEEDGQFLTDYLYEIESWTWFELYLFCNTMPLLSTKDLLFLGMGLFEKSDAFLNLPHNRLYIKQGLLNLFSEMIERKQFAQSYYFEEKLEETLFPYDIFEQISLKFLRKIRVFIKSQGENKKEIETFIQSLETIGNDELVALLRLKLEQYETLLKG